jgi:hypothetical protein
MSKSKSRQKYYDIPHNDFDFVIFPMIIRTVLEADDEDVPIEVIEDAINRLKRFKQQPSFVN